MKELINFEIYYDLKELKDIKWKIKYEKIYIKIKRIIEKYILL